jgi:hypothetical protein
VEGETRQANPPDVVDEVILSSRDSEHREMMKVRLL